MYEVKSPTGTMVKSADGKGEYVGSHAGSLLAITPKKGGPPSGWAVSLSPVCGPGPSGRSSRRVLRYSKVSIGPAVAGTAKASRTKEASALIGQLGRGRVRSGAGL